MEAASAAPPHSTGGSFFLGGVGHRGQAREHHVESQSVERGLIEWRVGSPGAVSTAGGGHESGDTGVDCRGIGAGIATDGRQNTGSAMGAAINRWRRTLPGSPF